MASDPQSSSSSVSQIAVSPVSESALEQTGTSRERISYADYWRVLRTNRNFRRLWFAQIVSEMGDWFYSLAIYSLLLELTGKAQSVALALMLQVIPQTLVNPTAGVINDRLRRQRVMITADLVRALIVTAMLLVRSRDTVWLVYVLLLFETIMWAMFEPARNAIIPNLVRGEDVILANTLSSTTWSFNLAIGATFGGLVMVVLGRPAVFVLNAASFLLSAALLSGMRFQEPHAENRPPFHWKELVDYTPVMEGVRYVRANARLFATVFVKSGVGIVGGSWVLYTVLGERVFPLHPHGMDAKRGAVLAMSLLMGSRGVGALIGPLLAAPFAGRRELYLRLGILLGFIACAIGYLGLSVAPNLWLACAVVIFAHCGVSIVWVFSTTLLQLYTDDSFRGRVFSADLGFCMLSVGTSAWIMGVAIDAGVPLRLLSAVMGAFLFTPAVAWALAQRSWRNS